jgi:putative transposase
MDWRFAVKHKRFDLEQIVAVLKQAEAGIPPVESEQTFYRWRKQYVELDVDQVRQPKQLQEENPRLKLLVADLTIDKAMLQDVLSKKFYKLYHTPWYKNSVRSPCPYTCGGIASG